MNGTLSFSNLFNSSNARTLAAPLFIVLILAMLVLPLGFTRRLEPIHAAPRSNEPFDMRRCGTAGGINKRTSFSAVATRVIARTFE